MENEIPIDQKFQQLSRLAPIIIARAEERSPPSRSTEIITQRSKAMVNLNQSILNQSINITNWGANSPALSPGLNPLLSPLSPATTSSDFQPGRTFLTENAGPVLNARHSG